MSAIDWTVTAAGLLPVVAALREVFHKLLHPSGLGQLSRAIFRAVWRAARRVGGRAGALAGQYPSSYFVHGPSPDLSLSPAVWRLQHALARDDVAPEAQTAATAGRRSLDALGDTLVMGPFASMSTTCTQRYGHVPPTTRVMAARAVLCTVVTG